VVPFIGNGATAKISTKAHLNDESSDFVRGFSEV